MFYFEKRNEVMLMLSSYSLCLCVSPYQLLIGLTNLFETLYEYCSPEAISKAYFINTSNHSVCLHVYHPIFAGQRFGKLVTATRNTHTVIKELLEASFSIRSMTYQRKIGD
jgi:hypothetical protein